jgi:CHAT domain-containing protein/tetratricopeptide (TPR) repeat protein
VNFSKKSAILVYAEYRTNRSLPNPTMTDSNFQNYLDFLRAFSNDDNNTSSEEEPLKLSLNRRLQQRADLLFIEGHNLFDASDFEAALQSWQKSLGIYRELGMRQVEGSILSNLGLACEGLGNYADSMNYMKQSLAIAREIDDVKGEGYVLLSLANIYCDIGQSEKAIDGYEKALEIGNKISDRHLQGSAKANLGNTHNILGNDTLVLEYLQDSLKIFTEEVIDVREQANILTNLGIFTRQQGDLTEAIKYFQQSLTLKRTIQDRRGEVNTLGRLGLFYGELGNWERAIDYHRQGVEISRAIQYRLGTVSSLKNLGETFLKSGNLAAAVEHLWESINLGDSLRSRVGGSDFQQVSFSQTLDLTSRLLQRVLIAENKPEEALLVADRRRSRVLWELLSARRKNGDLGTFAEPTVEQIKKIAREQKATIVEYSLIFDEFRIEGRLEVKESELFIWTVDPNGTIAFHSENLKPLWQQEKTTLASLVAIARQSLGVPGRDAVRVRHRDSASTGNKCLQQLYDLLVRPIADRLPKDESQRLIFIPHDSLLMLPFAALRSDAGGKYLIEERAILTAPSIQILNLARQQHRPIQEADYKNALVAGNPTMPSISLDLDRPPQQLKPLPGAKQEAETIAALLNTTAIVGEEATKQAIVRKLPEARIVHLATHGVLDYFQGTEIPGAIALAPSDEDNGLLTAEEIAKMQLSADLVVLSACDTGQGQLTGDGVMGLSRSLIAAGVPSIVVSLWSIPDLPTASLMTEFYQHLKEGLDKAQSLRLAMLAMMKRHPNNPLSWAAFMLVGEAEQA